ncbi:MAG: 50S ribosomal protein L29 [Flavobacteriaceae bacterium TMED120]|nr:MAG: 50S ribosomal protein L29 [Flavobacteriaceae bacterium TMED120]CAI8229131.1 MAG: 50S ribosomal protein L29 [Flavobacteriaceae bacterium]|tara:strand:+ start:6861 stop:7052 length:192 start_codon:yes stop_codon:yes gene_type:complete
MKQKEIQNLSKEDLQDKLDEVQKEYETLQLNHAISPLENPIQLRMVRRTIARLKTAIAGQKQA